MMVLLTALVSPARLQTVTCALDQAGLPPALTASAQASTLSGTILTHRGVRYPANAMVRVELMVGPAEAEKAAQVIAEAHDAGGREPVRMWTIEVGDPRRSSCSPPRQRAATTP